MSKIAIIGSGLAGLTLAHQLQPYADIHLFEKAQRAGGTTRYLPEKAWNKLTPAQKAATNRKKQAGSKAGKQFVANTPAAKKAGASARGTTPKPPVKKKKKK